MTLQKRAFALAVALFVGPSLLASEFALTPQKGILVLRNGRILEGEVLRSGDQYILKLAEGSEVRLPISAVERECATLDDVYQTKHAAIDRNNPDQHLDLARWCIQHRLHRQASGELTAAKNLDPNNPRTKLVERQLALATRPPLQIAKPKEVSATSITTLADLDRMMGDLPERAVEQFTSTIQPILMNGCAISNCHGPGSTLSYRLMRPTSGRIFARRFTQRNLNATLKLINRNEPSQSLLLTISRIPHGHKNRAVFGQYEKPQYDRLRAWVELVTQANSRRTPAELRKPATNLLQATGIQRPRVSPADSLEGAVDREPATSTVPTDPPTSSTKPRPAPTRTMKNEYVPYVPIDPFDPEIFNRKFFGVTKHATVNLKSEADKSQLPSPSISNSFRANASKK